MAILFMGGEEIDFDRFTGSAQIVTDTGFRSDFARCAIFANGGGTDLENTAKGSFAPSSAFWFTARIGVNTASDLPATGVYRTLLSFADGATKRLSLMLDGGRTLRVTAYNNAGAETILTTGTEAIFAPNAFTRLDVQVTYGATGRIRVFVNQALFLDFSGNLNLGLSTTLSGFTLGTFNTNSLTSGTHWSECIVADQDTRTLSLKTHVPLATAPAHAWQGSAADVSETLLDESNMITTTALDAVAAFTVSPLPAGNYAVRGFKVSAWAAKGDQGPSKLNLGVNTNFGPDLTLDTGWGKFSQTFDTNPATGAGWTQTEINAIQIAAKSKL